MMGFLLLSIAYADRMRGIRYLLVKGRNIGIDCPKSKGLGKRGLIFS